MKQRSRCSTSFMKEILVEKRSDTGKTETPRQRRPPHLMFGDFRTSSGPTGPPPIPLWPSKRRPHSGEPIRAFFKNHWVMHNSSSAGQAGPSPSLSCADPPTLNCSSEEVEMGGVRKARGQGRRRRHHFFVFPGQAAHAGRHRRRRPGWTWGRPGARNPEAARQALFPRPCECDWTGGREPGLRPRRHDDAFVFVLPELAGGLPSPGRRRPLGFRRRPTAPQSSAPTTSPGRTAGSPASPPHHSPCGARSRARARHRRGGAGPSPQG